MTPKRTINRAIGKVLSGLLLGIVTVAAQAADTTTIEASTQYEGQSFNLPVEISKPEGSGPFPAVVLMHGCGGLSPAVRGAMQSYAEYFVRHGFVSLVLDSFGPRKNDDGSVCETYDRLMRARNYRLGDALDALNHLRSLEYVDDEHVFQLGQSNGGSVSIRLAQLQKPEFRAVAALYPWCGTFARLGSKAELTSPLIVLAGALDQWTPPGDCLTLVSTDAEYRTVVYPGAVHSFDLEISRQKYAGQQVGYDAAAAEDARKQILNFFHDYLSPSLKQSLPEITLAAATPVVYLSGDEILQLMPSGKLKGVNSFGNPYTITYTGDGGMSGVAGNNDEYRDTGKWWIEQDSFCRQYKSWLEGKAACFRVSLDGENIGFYDAAGKFVSGGKFVR